MDPWIHGSAAGPAARAAAGAAAGATAASAAAVCIYYVTRCTCLGAAHQSLARKFLDGPRRSRGQARAAERGTDVRFAHIFFFFAFCLANAVSRPVA